MVQDTSLELVMSRLRSGDQDAARLIFQRFVHRLTALASHQLDARLRAKAEPEDVVQSVYKSFFARNDRTPYDLSDWDSLWSLLATITVRKCSDRRTFWLAARRSVGREGRPADGPDDALWSALDRGPTPLQATSLAEILEALLADLSPAHRAVAERSLQGDSAPEVARRCGCSERTVARVVAGLKKRLREIDSDGPRP